MKAGNDRSHAQALAQEYITKLVHESAPASYLPVLASVMQAPLLPLALKVHFLYVQPSQVCVMYKATQKQLCRDRNYLLQEGHILVCNCRVLHRATCKHS